MAMATADLFNAVQLDEDISLVSDDRIDAESPLPVKNTFIHFTNLQQNRVRCLRRVRTDPGEPFGDAVRSHKLASASTVSLASSDACSTTEPASDSDADPLESLTPLDFEGISTHTPEQTPRHVRDPWTSPEASPVLPPVSVTPAESPTPTPTQSQSTSSSQSSSPTSSSFLEAAFSSLANSGSPAFLEGGFCFGMTLRLADDVGLGVDLAPHVGGVEKLWIERILPNGAISAWNKQCFQDCTSKRLKAVWPGDTIVSVNGKTDHWDMLQECKTKMLLKLTIYRAVCDNTMNTLPTGCMWPPAPMHGLMLQAPRLPNDGQRLHSCKKLIII